MRVLIIGAGIAGLTLALCLRRRGHQVRLVEKAPRLREEGYMIDFFSDGYDVAERLGLLPALAQIHYQIERLDFVREDGAARVSLSYPDLRRMFGGRHFNFMRGDLERVLFEQLDGEVRIHFGTTVHALQLDRTAVRVLLSDDTEEEADLLIGADGLHSEVRGLLFGEEQHLTRYLGYHVAAYVIDAPELHRELRSSFQTLTVPGRQVAVYPIRGGRVATFFAHRAEEPPEDHGPEGARRELLARYGGLGWRVPELLARAPADAGLYLDAVSQVVCPSWSRQCAALLGDAAWCVSLMAGQGASLAMAGAYVLAEELGRGEDVTTALARYERRLRPGVRRKQRAGRRIAGWFVPRSRLGLAVRDLFLRASTGPLGEWLLRRQLAADSVLWG